MDWSILRNSEKAETSNKSYTAYIRESFGQAYRLSDKNWKKLYSGKFYNPVYYYKDINASKIMIFHAKDDPYVSWESVNRFAKLTGVKFKSLNRGGHLSTNKTIQKNWDQIKKFFEEK